MLRGSPLRRLVAVAGATGGAAHIVSGCTYLRGRLPVICTVRPTLEPEDGSSDADPRCHHPAPEQAAPAPRHCMCRRRAPVSRALVPSHRPALHRRLGGNLAARGAPSLLRIRGGRTYPPGSPSVVTSPIGHHMWSAFGGGRRGRGAEIRHPAALRRFCFRRALSAGVTRRPFRTHAHRDHRAVHVHHRVTFCGPGAGLFHVARAAPAVLLAERLTG